MSLSKSIIVAVNDTAYITVPGATIGFFVDQDDQGSYLSIELIDFCDEPELIDEVDSVSQILKVSNSLREAGQLSWANSSVLTAANSLAMRISWAKLGRGVWPTPDSEFARLGIDAKLRELVSNLVAAKDHTSLSKLLDSNVKEGGSKDRIAYITAAISHLPQARVRRAGVGQVGVYSPLD